MPPRLEMDDYSLCVPFKLEGSCRLGDRCVYAHSNEELIEWRERLEYRYAKINRTHIVRDDVMNKSVCICRRNRIVKNQKMVGKTFVESLMERMAGSNNPEKVRPTLQFYKKVKKRRTC